jgi:DNA end-binding protein Ku
MGGAYPVPSSGKNLTISFGLVNVGVKYAPIVDSKKGRVSGKFVDPADKGPVTQQYVNAAGKAVEKVTAYPTEGGEMVVLSQGDVQSLKSERDGRLELKAFVEPEGVDPLYFEKTLLVWPAAGQEASYDVLCEVLKQSDRYLVGTSVLTTATKVVVLRYTQECLFAHVCNYDDVIRWNEQGLVTGAMGQRPAADDDLVKLATQVFETLDDTFDFASVKDEYDERLRAAIVAKAEGREIVAETVEPLSPVVDLMAALKASIADAKAAKEPAKKKAPAKKAAVKKAA